MNTRADQIKSAKELLRLYAETTTVDDSDAKIQATIEGLIHIQACLSFAMKHDRQ